MEELGKNMMVISLGKTKVIIDMGIKLENILNSGESSLNKMDREKLVNIGGIPDDSKLRSQEVSAIILTHGHLDHIGAIGKLAHEYEAPIYATPFTAELVKKVIQEERVFAVENEIKEVELGDSNQIDDVEVEFIQGVHSIPQNSFPAIKSSEGVVLCVGGFKMDKDEVLGFSNDFKSIKQLSNSGDVISLIGAVRADEPEPTPPESHAKKMLKDVMTKASDEADGILITTFSSHITRIKTIVELSFKLNRKPVILGRSIAKKCKIASKLGIVDFPSELNIFGHPNSIRKALKSIKKFREDFVVITTGHQGERNAILSRIADKREPYKIETGDEVIFSASVIPTAINIANRKLLEAKLKAQGARIHRDVHVSGHARRPGTKKMIEKISPDHIIPFHGTPEKMKSVLKIGREIGYSEDQLHMAKNGQTLSPGA